MEAILLGNDSWYDILSIINFMLGTKIDTLKVKVCVLPANDIDMEN